MSSKVTILWGEAPDDDDEPVVYEFYTQAELAAFLYGITEASGWGDYQIVKLENTGHLEDGDLK
jgi:hypothetical protein